MAQPNSRASRLMGWITLARQAGSYGEVSTTETPKDNPKDSARSKLKVEYFDPKEEVIRAMIQGIYESKLEELLEKPFFDGRGRRLDVRTGVFRHEDLVPNAKKTAFRIGKGNAQKFGYLQKDRNGNWVPTRKATEESFRRYENYDHLMDNRQTYEETLALTRVSFYRVTQEPTRKGLRYLVWPLVPGQETPITFENREEAFQAMERQNQRHDPRETGRWWKMPEKQYHKRDLAEWLPPESAFDVRSRG
jgi:hypothetical protein